MRTMFIFEEYRDSWGAGTVTTFTTKEEAIKAAREAWEHMNDHDKSTYRNDKMGVFRVFEASIPEEVDLDEVVYNDYWASDVIDLLND